MPRRKIDPPRGVLKTSAVERQRFEHARYHPSPDLARYVEHYWAVQWDLRGTPPHEVETLPHPSVHLVFERGGNGRIAGVAKGRFTTRLEGSGGVFAAKFRPGGFRPFTRTPISTYTDRTVRLGSVWGSAGDGLERTVLALNDDDERMQVVEAFLRERLPEQDELVTQVAAIVELIAADRTILAVDDVARRFGLNLRALQRLFAEYVGVNPKWVIQRYRLHEAAEQLAGGPINQAALALELGYADQAHFVKDFKATMGTSPAAYAKRAQDIR